MELQEWIEYGMKRSEGELGLSESWLIEQSRVYYDGLGKKIEYTRKKDVC